MHVALCAPYGLAQVSGISAFLVEYATRLRDSGHRVGVFTPDRVPWLTLLPVGMRDLAFAAWTFAALLRDAPWTAVHANQPHPQSVAALLAARIAGARAVVTYHSSLPPAHRRSSGILQDVANRILARGADARTFVSEATRSMYPRVNGTVVPLGVDLAALEGIRATAPRLEGGPFVFLFAGRETKSKGFFDVLGAAERAREVLGPDAFRLWLAGEVPANETREKLVQLARLGDVVVDHGPVRDRESYLRLLASADALVLPSYREGLPRVLVEAMALSCVPIVTPVGGIPDLVREGETGYLVRPGDIVAIADAMIRLARTREQIEPVRQRARDAVGAFSLDAAVATFLSLYEERLI